MIEQKVRAMYEKNILELAKKRIEEIFNFPVRIYSDCIGKNSTIGVDCYLSIDVNEHTNKFCVEIKNTISRETVALLLHKFHKAKYPMLLVTKYINPILAEELKRSNIQFVDAVGNMYLNAFPMFIFVKGNKEDKSGKLVEIKAFNPSGLKLIFEALVGPAVLNKPYREIVNTSGIALGSVGLILSDLQKLGFLLDMGKRGKILQNNKVLFDRWCTEYVEKLKPKQLIGVFEGPKYWWKNYDLNPKHAKWGGEVAAFKLDKYLNPEHIQIYCQSEKYKDILIANKLYKNENGHVNIYKQFWQSKTDFVNEPLVHPLLIYADLIGSADERNIQAARRIYEKYLTRYLG
jgi:hypothetical protein